MGVAPETPLDKGSLTDGLNKWKLAQTAFVSPWISGNYQYKQNEQCYFCSGNRSNVIPFDEKQGYCGSCFAPIRPNYIHTKKWVCVDEVIPCKTPSLFQDVYPLAYLSGLSTIITVATTGVLVKFKETKPWVLSLIIGGSTSFSLWLSWFLCRSSITPSPNPVSITSVITVFSENQAFFRGVLKDENDFYQIQYLLKMIILTETNFDDPIVNMIRAIKPHNHFWLTQWSLKQVMDHFDLYATDAFRAALDDFKNSFSSELKTVVVTNGVTQTQLEVLFQLISCSNDAFSIELKAEGLVPNVYSFENVHFSENMRAFSVTNLHISKFHPSLWKVQDSITLQSIRKIETLPDINGISIETDAPLSLTINDCPILYLPRTIAGRKVQAIDLTNCQHIKDLPSTLTLLVQEGILQKLDLTGTSVNSAYRMNIVFNEAVRKVLSELDEDNESNLFCDRTTLPIKSYTPYDPYKAFDIPLPLQMLNTFSFLTCFGLLGLVFDKFFVSKNNRKGVTEKASFWAAYGGMSALSTLFLWRIKRPESIPRMSCCWGRSVDGVWQLLQRRGRECINGHTYDWDRLWRHTFIQPSILHSEIPEPVMLFVKTWMDFREDQYTTELSQPLARFIEANGGRAYMDHLSDLPFYDMITRIQQDAFKHPCVLNAVRQLRESLNPFIYLAFKDIIGGDIIAPELDIFLMRSYFALINSGEQTKLVLDWSLYGLNQPLSPHWTYIGPNISELWISNAIIPNNLNNFWHVSNRVRFTNCESEALPEVPVDCSQTPLALEMEDCDFETLPNNVNMRPISHLYLHNCHKMTHFPAALKELISSKTLEVVKLSETAIITTKGSYEKEELTLLLEEEHVFADAIPQHTAVDMPQPQNWAGLWVGLGAVVVGIAYLWKNKQQHHGHHHKHTLFDQHPLTCQKLKYLIYSILEDKTNLEPFYALFNMIPDDVRTDSLLYKKIKIVGIKNEPSCECIHDVLVFNIPVSQEAFFKSLHNRFVYELFRFEVRIDLKFYNIQGNIDLREEVVSFLTQFGYTHQGNGFFIKNSTQMIA